MFKKFTKGCVNVVNRWLPDPFLFAVILSIVVFIAAVAVTGLSPAQTLNAWGSDSGFWGLLGFSMQMALVLVLGSAMASAPICKRALGAIAGLAHNKRGAIMVTTFVSLICCWVNWGFGLVAGALLAKEVARRVRGVDYRLLIASAYSGFLVWHAGLSGSIPLSLVEGKEFEGVVYQAGLGESIFHPMNLVICLVILVALPLINYAMHPDDEHTITVNPELLKDEEERKYEAKTPAEKMEHSRILWVIVGVAGIAYVIYYFVTKGKAGVSFGNSLTLNIVNFIFLFAGIILHGDLRRYVDAIGKAASSAAGILLQFPFYAGIMGMMTVKNAAGISLAGEISNVFVSISNHVTYPLLTFLSAGIVNFFVPSGGGQWAVQGPIVMKAAGELGVNYGLAATALAWGDAWTNMIQPFWALPALGIAGLSARDIMGYLVIVLVVSGLIICGGLVIWALIL
ncbi:MAG: short-chain fatty acid transporter [Oscillospiraceae bacterium]